MAAADYHLCCVCGKKAFYDASIANDDYIEKCERGQVKALCNSCALNHEIIVAEKTK